MKNLKELNDLIKLKEKIKSLQEGIEICELYSSHSHSTDCIRFTNRDFSLNELKKVISEEKFNKALKTFSNLINEELTYKENETQNEINKYQILKRN